ncbi:MAG: Ig-like domain-containing protein, partial [Clostridia bacterium]|nr:Ig-like domain-containing protein [Clostridia bacterium]
MRKTSKIVAIISAFIILVSMFVISSNAVSVKYYATSVSGQKGDTVTISVKVTNSSKVELSGVLVSLVYNSSELQYISCSSGSLIMLGEPTANNSAVKFAGLLNHKQSVNGGTIFTAKFKILKDSGTSTLKVTAGTGGDNIDYSGNPVTATTSNGTVTIVKNITGISLNKTSVTLKKGETSKLVATVTPSDATNKTVTYSTSDKYVAKVSSDGT